MGEVVNLRQKRKAKLRAEAEQKAATNRAQFGRAKAEKQLTKMLHTKTEKSLDGHQRED